MIRYTRILICPKTGKQVSNSGHYYNRGICEVCGDDSISTICHAENEVGYWLHHPSRSWYEFWIKPKWVRKNNA